ncbi:MAG: ABC transporter permease [Phycisphaerales bacterium JB037]
MAFLLETMRLGLKNLWIHRLRSLLTALGIILGVAAVITMVSIGEGKKQAALTQIEQLGARNIIIRSQQPPQAVQQQAGQQQSLLAKYGITRDDLRVLEANFPDAEAIVPVKKVGSNILRGDRRQASQAYGTTPGLLDLAKLRVRRGRYLTREDLDNQSAVCVIGSEVAKELFPFDDPLGSTIRIDSSTFRVVGVLQPVGLSGGAGGALVGRDLNLDVHLPITTARIMFGDQTISRQSGGLSASEVQISEVYVSSPSRDRVLDDEARIRRIMEVRHPDLTDIGLIVPYELLEAAKKEAVTSNLVFGSIAAIALLVGGIGIMNIMLASVTERTREIGIRRAIGATRKHITAQFLVETSVLSAIGGLIGVVVGVGLSLGLEPMMNWLPTAPFIGHFFDGNVQLPTDIPMWAVVLSFTVATLTGLIFGIYPAMKAAAQDPIVALRHD